MRDVFRIASPIGDEKGEGRFDVFGWTVGGEMR
jgi:hypothetical protein